jgi:L-lactate dehydrogenase complex protein LldF
MEGLTTAGDLAMASTLCNACEEVCPVRIPIPTLIRRVRNESYDTSAAASIPGHGFRRNIMEITAWKAWALVNSHRSLNRLIVKLTGCVGRLLPVVGPLKAWTLVRSRPQFASKSLHQLAREKGIPND